MNTKPILFSTEMVQAILAGRKTQTRRIVKIKGSIPNNETKPLSTHSCNSVYYFWGHDEVACPYGSPGDILWVRESFTFNPIGKTDYLYKADSLVPKFIKWKPSIHMPKEACRLFLKVTNVRVERLFEISENDAALEGVLCDVEIPVNFKKLYYYRDYTGNTSGCADARSSFMTLWKKINGESSWKSNPWVWVIEFERIEKPENF